MVKHALLVVVGLVLLLPAGAGGDGPVSIEESALPPPGRRGYTYQFERSRKRHQLRRQGGDLPDGLSLDSAGLLSGVPTITGHFSFVVITYNTVTGGTEQHAAMDVVAPPALTLGPPEVTQTTALLREARSRQLRPTPGSNTGRPGRRTR